MTSEIPARRLPGLSKSRVMLGLQCHKRLWWTLHEPDAPELQPSAALEAILDGGSQVGELARTYVPGGILIDVYHPDFGGSFSLKQVLPALVPDLAYDGLAIADGSTASAELARLMLAGEIMPAADRQSLRTALLAYCRQDTLGLVRLLEHLRQLAAT